MSHELRTPLHGILGLSRILARNLAPAERETVSLIQRSGEHLLGLINNVLEFSRFEAHGIDIHPQEVDVVRIIDEAVAMCMPSALERRLNLSSELALPASLVALIDPFRLRQILLNLIGNAIKFTEPGGSIKVRAIDNESGASLAISVADTGIGMTPAALEHLFEPFSQGDISTTRRHGGTGLGLSITRAICRQMGGEITCTSASGPRFGVQRPVAAAACRSAERAAGQRAESRLDVPGGTLRWRHRAAGRRQRGQCTGRRIRVEALRRAGRSCRLRAGGRRTDVHARRASRSRAARLPDAGHGWLRGRPSRAGVRKGARSAPCAARCIDGERVPDRSRSVPRCRNGRLPRQAVQ